MKKKIVIWSPANDGTSLNSDNVKAGKEMLETSGYSVQFSDVALKGYKMGVTPRQSRLNVLKEVCEEVGDVMLMSTYGGYTANLLLDDLSVLENKENIILTGKSDLTCILNAIYTKYKRKSVYGIDFSKICNPFQTDLDKDIIFSALNLKTIRLKKQTEFNDGFWYLHPPIDYPSKKWEIFGTISEGIVNGISLGGNIESLLALSGTEYMPNFKDKIVVLETIPDISAGHFIMLFKSMIMSTNLNEAKVIVLGQFEPKSCLNEREIMEEILSEIGNIVPLVIANADLSHTEPSYPFYIGGSMELNILKNEIMISW